MGYRIRKGKPFSVGIETWAHDARSLKIIPKTDWGSHGFRLDMTPEEAKAHAKAVNALEGERRHRERREAIRRRLENETNTLQVQVPLSSEFERELTGKQPFYWRTCLKMLVKLGLSPRDYHARREAIWGYFKDEGFSPAYVQKLTQVLNKYGQYYAWKHQSFYLTLPTPRGRWRERLVDASMESESGGNKESKAITPKMLKSVSTKLKPEHYNWLYLTVWLGLLPQEADGLKNNKTYRIEKIRGIPVIHVYQSKLQSIAREKRWKAIPCFRPEMEECVKIIQDGIFKRPLSKRIVNLFGEEYGLYGGRKGFTDLMLSLGQDLEDISLWMGHTTIERTWRSYKDKAVVNWK